MKKSLLLLALLPAFAAPALAVTIVTEYVAPPPTGTPAPSAAPGLYVGVLDGVILAMNTSGTQSFTAGQFGFVGAAGAPPTIVPVNPGLQFTPPPAFTSGVSAGTGNAQQTVDCVVR